MEINPIIPIILSGGSGTRLWPLSRESFPKQYIDVMQDSANSMLQITYQRLIGLKNLTEPIIICNKEHRFIVAEQFREINVKRKSIILEPCARNTAPAIALGALKALELNKDPVLLILSSDHQVKDPFKFKDCIKKGIISALENKLVVFGINPTSPETGYGYIKATQPYEKNNQKKLDIEEFVEKPNYETALKLIEDKRYLWNSGIFLFKANVIINELKKFEPNIIENCIAAIRKEKNDLDFQRIDKTEFEKCPSISIDYAVFEKTKIGSVIPMDAGWSDLGNWNSIWQNSPKNSNGNVTNGNVILKNSEKCYLRSEDRLLVGIGLKNIIAVQTGDATLIADQKESQKIKNVVEELNKKNIKAGHEHQKVFRPWGYYKQISEGENWKVKEIFVKPNSSLSLQLHNFRSEHWVVVSGVANVQIGDSFFILKKNESIYVPVKEKHKLTNSSGQPLSIIEVQNGSYLGEDDIKRFEDLYGRINY